MIILSLIGSLSDDFCAVVKQEAALSLGSKSPRHRTAFSLCHPVVCAPILRSCVQLRVLHGSLWTEWVLQDVHRPKDEKKNWLWSIHIALLGGIETVVHKIHCLWGFWGWWVPALLVVIKKYLYSSVLSGSPALLGCSVPGRWEPDWSCNRAEHIILVLKIFQ